MFVNVSRRTLCRQFLELRVWVLALCIATLFILSENFLIARQFPHGGPTARGLAHFNKGHMVDSSVEVRRGHEQTWDDNPVGQYSEATGLVTGVSDAPYYLGCWLFQDMTDKHIRKSPKMTPRMCIRHCSNHNTTYALISDGDQCACSDTLQEYLTGTDCTRRCPGNRSYLCGGLFTSSVYVVNETYPSLPLDGAPRKVLLLAYMRTGSTFTSQMFNTYGDSFYIFEPFFRLDKYQHLSVIQNLLSCKFDRVPKDVFLYQWSYWHRRHMQKSLSHFYTCMDNLKSVGYYRCLPLATIACERSSLRIIKEIQIDMASAVTMQRVIPELYVFHLVRDPRAVTNSRIHVHERNTPRHLDKYCNDLESDLQSSKEIPSENFYFLQYEKISEHPLETVESLYTFINLTLTQEVLEWVKTATGMKDPCKGRRCIIAYGTTRKNSSSTAYKWKQSLPWKIVKYVDKSCRKVYRQLGYLPIRNEHDLRNPALKHRTW